MIRTLGFLTGALLVGVILFLLAEQPQMVNKATQGEVTTEDLKQALNHGKARLQRSLEIVTAEGTAQEVYMPRLKSEGSAPEALPATALTDRPSPSTPLSRESANPTPGPLSKSLSKTLHSPTAAQSEAAAQPSMPYAPLAAPETRALKTPRAGAEATSPATAPITLAVDRLADKSIQAPINGSRLSPETAISRPGKGFERALSGNSVQPGRLMTDNWHPLWKSFRSQLSAEGFATRLQKLSGRELRILPQGPGRYTVQLRYLDPGDLEQALQKISDTSGLDLVALKQPDGVQ